MTMNSQLGSWLQLGGNLGILIGLILVGLQMRQSTELLELQLRKTEAENYISSDLSVLGEEWPRVWQKQFDDPKGLTLAEQRILEATLWADNVYRWASNYRLYEDGLTEADEWQSQVDTDIAWVLGNPYGRAWWDEVKVIPTLPPELVEYVESKLKDVSPYATKEIYDRIRDGAGRYVKLD
jgi:hypothetical protein